MRIQNPVKHIKWSVLRKLLTSCHEMLHLEIIDITNRHVLKYQCNKPYLYFFITDFEEHQEDINPTFDDDDECDDDYSNELHEKDD